MDKLLRLRPEATDRIVDSFVSTGQLVNDWERYTEETGLDCDLDLLSQLSMACATLLKAEEMDAWLAPRLHAALRIPRRVAADPQMWAWLALRNATFVKARFGQPNRTMHPWRYRGAWSRNGLSRLWWGAEMTRNGRSYADVRLCFGRTRTAQFTLELMYSWHRAAAIAFSRVAEGVDGERLNDDAVRMLSTRLRVLLPLRCLEGVETEPLDAEEEFDESWASHRPSLSSLMSDLETIEGPNVGMCSESAIQTLMRWYRTVLRMAGTTSVASEA